MIIWKVFIELLLAVVATVTVPSKVPVVLSKLSLRFGWFLEGVILLEFCTN